VDFIKMDLREIGWGDVDCIDLAEHSDHWKTEMKLLMFEYSSMAAEVVASEEGLLPIELVIT
jgi:hypothetical protein